MIYRIDREARETKAQKGLGFFIFKPCWCGCTKGYGFGVNLWFFGFNIYFKRS